MRYISILSNGISISCNEVAFSIGQPKVVFRTPVSKPPIKGWYIADYAIIFHSCALIFRLQLSGGKSRFSKDEMYPLWEVRSIDKHRISMRKQGHSCALTFHSAQWGLWCFNSVQRHFISLERESIKSLSYFWSKYCYLIRGRTPIRIGVSIYNQRRKLSEFC